MTRGRHLKRPRFERPQRRCVGCRTVKPQSELMRLAAKEGRVVPGRHEPGRGCWLCRDEKCAREALKRGEFSRALKGKAGAPALDSLLDWMGLRSLDGDGGRGLKS